jgi:glyoxylase-like metal-dependent hydrolase (beta-lactamase superfamily II)
MSTRTTTQAFFDPKTWTVCYLVWDSASRHAAVIDPVLDYDFKSGHTSTSAADQVLACVREQGLQVDWILETHAHADHLSGARYLQERLDGRTGRIAIGEHIREVQATFQKIYNLVVSTKLWLFSTAMFGHLNGAHAYSPCLPPMRHAQHLPRWRQLCVRRLRP